MSRPATVDDIDDLGELTFVSVFVSLMLNFVLFFIILIQIFCFNDERGVEHIW